MRYGGVLLSAETQDTVTLHSNTFFGIRTATKDINYRSLLTRAFIFFIFRFQSRYCESQTIMKIATNIAT